MKSPVVVVVVVVKARWYHTSGIAAHSCQHMLDIEQYTTERKKETKRGQRLCASTLGLLGWRAGHHHQPRLALIKECSGRGGGGVVDRDVRTYLDRRSALDHRRKDDLLNRRCHVSIARWR